MEDSMAVTAVLSSLRNQWRTQCPMKATPIFDPVRQHVYFDLPLLAGESKKKCCKKYKKGKRCKDCPKKKKKE